MSLKTMYVLAFSKRLAWILATCTLGLVVMSGCGESGSEDAKLSSVSTPPPPEFKLNRELDELSLPSGIVLIGGINKVKDAQDALASELPNYLPTAFDLRAQWLDDYINYELGLSAQFIHPDRPLRIIKIKAQQSLSTVHLLGVLNRAELMQQFEPPLERVEIGSEEVYVHKPHEGITHPRHFVFLADDIVVSTRDPALLTPQHIKFYRELSHTRLVGLIGGVIFPQVFTQIWGGLHAVSDAIRRAELRGSLASQTRQRGSLLSLSTWIYEVAYDSQRVRFALYSERGRLQSDVQWEFKEGSATARALGAVSAQAPRLLHEVSDAALLMSATLPMSWMNRLIKHLNDSIILSHTMEIKRLIPLKPKVEEDMTEGDQHSKAGSKKRSKQRSKKRSKQRSKSSKPLKRDLPPVLGSLNDELSDYTLAVTQAAQALNGELLIGVELRSPQAQAQELSGHSTPEEREALRLPNLTRASQSWFALFGHQGQVEMRERLQALFDMYQDASIKHALKKRGVELKFGVDEVIPPLKTPSHSVSTRVSRVPSRLKRFRSWLRDPREAHVWVGERFGIIGFSNTWRETLASLGSRQIEQRAVLSPERPKDLARAKSTEDLERSDTPKALERPRTHERPAHLLSNMISDALVAAVPHPFFFLYADPISWIRSSARAAPGSLLLPLQMIFAPAAQQREGIALSVNAQARRLSMRLTIPKALLSEIRALMSSIHHSTLGLAPSPNPTADLQVTSSDISPKTPSDTNASKLDSKEISPTEATRTPSLDHP